MSLCVAGCSTPDALKDGATLSSAELANMQTQLKNYTIVSNRDNASRLERLRGELDADLVLAAEIEAKLYTSLAGDSKLTALHKELGVLNYQARARDAAAAKLKEQYSSQLRGLTTDLTIAAKPFKDIQEALAKLAKPKDQKAQLTFIAAYMRSVIKEYEKERDELKKKAAEDAKDKT